MEIAVKITLIASLILVGYSVSQMLTSFDAICEKVKRFKELAIETNSGDSELKMSNTILTGLMALVFVVLTYFSGLALWVVAVVATKLIVTCFMSYVEISRILKNEEMEPNFYRLAKVDAVINALMGLAVAIILVA